MTLDEAIKHSEEVAVWHEAEANKYESNGYEGYVQSQCLENADEHRQLAKWLKELKAHRESWEKAKRTVKAYLMLEEFCVEYQDDIEKLIDGCRPKEGDVDERNSN